MYTFLRRYALYTPCVYTWKRLFISTTFWIIVCIQKIKELAIYKFDDKNSSEITRECIWDQFVCIDRPTLNQLQTGHLFIIVRTDNGQTVLVHKKQEEAVAASFKQKNNNTFYILKEIIVGNNEWINLKSFSQHKMLYMIKSIHQFESWSYCCNGIVCCDYAS